MTSPASSSTIKTLQMITMRIRPSTIRYQQQQLQRLLYGSSSTIAQRGIVSTLTSPFPNSNTTRLASTSASASQQPSDYYVSPFADLFERMERNETSSVPELSAIGYNGENSATSATSRKVLQCGIPEDVLRFTSSSYGRTLQAPTVHPNEHRVILKVHTKYLPLSDTELELLSEIVGPARFNVERNELRLSSNQFGSRIENKRYLVSMLDRLVLSCQKMGRELRQTTIHHNDNDDERVAQN